jgi:hypothetical protein
MTGFDHSIQCRSDTQTLLAIEQINPAFSRSTPVRSCDAWYKNSLLPVVKSDHLELEHQGMCGAAGEAAVAVNSKASAKTESGLILSDRLPSLKGQTLPLLSP